MHSIPISSANCASRTMFSQLASQRSASVAEVLPLEQLAPKTPSLRALPLTITALRCRISAPSLAQLWIHTSKPLPLPSCCTVACTFKDKAVCLTMELKTGRHPDGAFADGRRHAARRACPPSLALL